MTPERFQQIEELYHAARGSGVEKRTALLAAADPEVRREVESLLAREGEGKFLERPVVQNAAQLVDDPTFTILTTGTCLGPYRVEGKIGAGGMGEVYRAIDTRLGRAVAIKTTREQFSERFEREARAISSLNHPNICTIYDVGPNYLVMEMVEGETLAERLKSGPLPLETALLYASQILAALAEAHEKGIIHRDLKPGNIMIAKSGIKVLDFGLAKSQQDETLTISHMVMGTPAYMAPEQREGQAADTRSDIYSFGCVLYEMLTGARAGGQRKAIGSRKLDAIVNRCLEEDPTLRWQSAVELQRELAAITAARSDGKRNAMVRARRPWVLSGAGAVVFLLLAAGGYEWFREKPPPLPAVASEGQWVQLTDFEDSAVSPALSPDGHILTFIRGGSTFYSQGEIYAKVLPNGEPVQLTHDSVVKMSPQFSPDGSNIAYTTVDLSADEWNTSIIPTLGGEPRLMLPNAEGLTWIDSGHLLFSEITAGLHMPLVTALETRDHSRDVYVPPSDRGMVHRSALSPDHKWVMLVEMDNGGWLPCRLVPFDGSSTGKPIGPSGAGCTYVAWSPDQKWMYVSSDAGGHFHIWRQRFPDGEPEQVTAGATEEEGIAVAPDGRSLITSVGLRQSTLWIRDSKGERQVSSEGYAAYPQFSPDGKKLYYLVRREGGVFDDMSMFLVSGELWAADLQTGQNERLLPNFLVTGYSISHDGTQIVFSAKDKENRPHLWLASLDFRFPPRQFSSSANDDEPHWDAHGHIYFRAAEGESNYLYRMNADGSGRVKALADPILEFEDVSPDGRWALVARILGQQSPIYASSLNGGGSETLCHGLCFAQWTSDGGTFSVVLARPTGGDDTLVIPVSHSNSLPGLPAGGFQTRDMASVRGAKILDGFIVPGPKAGTLASLRRDVHRNLYSVPVQ